jgi:hypothetical protein
MSTHDVLRGTKTSVKVLVPLKIAVLALGVILAHNLVESGVVDGRKDVRKPRLRPWQVSVSAKHNPELPESPKTCWTQIAAFGRVAQPGT